MAKCLQIMCLLGLALYVVNESQARGGGLRGGGGIKKPISGGRLPPSPPIAGSPLKLPGGIPDRTIRPMPQQMTPAGSGIQGSNQLGTAPGVQGNQANASLSTAGAANSLPDAQARTTPPAPSKKPPNAQKPLEKTSKSPGVNDLSRGSLSSTDNRSLLGLADHTPPGPARDAIVAALEGKALTPAQRSLLGNMLQDKGKSLDQRLALAHALQNDSPKHHPQNHQSPDDRPNHGAGNDMPGGGSSGNEGGGGDGGGSPSPGGGSGDATQPGPTQEYGQPVPFPPPGDDSNKPQEAATRASDQTRPADAGQQGGESLAPKQASRYLQIKNDTGAKLTVYLQYRKFTEAKKWAWLPADPQNSQNALVFELEPGQEASLEDDNGRIQASRVRLWAQAPGNAQWLEHRDQDLWLVPEKENSYRSKEVETFTFAFSR